MAGLGCLVFAGYVWLFVDKHKLHPAQAPLAAMSVMVLLLYVGGMLRMLHLAWGIVALAGLGCFGWMLKKRSRALLNADLAFFAIACILLWLRYRSALLVQYDDYSHWGMIVRHLLTHNRLPTPADELITFQSYPPGAALWIYGFCRFMGETDGVMLVGQAVMTLAGWLPLFALAGKNGGIIKRAGVSAVMLIGLSLFQGTASLMVDNLIAALAIGALCMLIWDWRNGKNHAGLLGIMIALICLTKDSGLFFAGVLGIAYLALYARRGKAWLKGLLKLCVPSLAARGIWLFHIKTAFEDMFYILKKLLEKVTDFQNQAVQILLLMFVLGLALIVIRKVSTGKLSLGTETIICLGAAAVYAAWVASLGFMYIFSMPVINAKELVAYERYNSTCALFLYGAMIAWLLCINTEKIPAKAGAVCAVVIMLVPLLNASWTAGLPRLFQESYFVPLRTRMEVLYRTRPLEAGENAAVLIDETDAGIFSAYMARYSFQSSKIMVVTQPADDVDVLYVASEEKEEWNTNAQVVYWQDFI